jgi:CMP-N-acetylneuraminic acid synthetase
MGNKTKIKSAKMIENSRSNIAMFRASGDIYIDTKSTMNIHQRFIKNIIIYHISDNQTISELNATITINHTA